MKTTVKVLGIIGIVVGTFAIIGSLEVFDFYGVIGGIWFIGWGIVNVYFVNQLDAKKK